MGDSFMTIRFSYRVGSSTVAGIVGAVSQAIWDCLVEEYVPVPTKQDWRDISEGVLQRWNFPNCLGSINGKHVVIQAPHSSGSLYHNYKGTFSIVLLAVVDADCMFRVIDVGGYGRNSDGGTLGNFGLALKNGTLDLPENCIIPGAEPRGPLPHVFEGDEAFPLRSNLLRPFPGTNLSREKRMFNYCLSRARLTVVCLWHTLQPVENVLACHWCQPGKSRGVCEGHLHPPQLHLEIQERGHWICRSQS